MDVKKRRSQDVNGDIEVIKNLRNTIKILKAESMAKTEFIANLIHDIRSPLTGILGLSGHLSEITESLKEKECARVIHEGSQQLLDLLNSILDSGKKAFLEDKTVSHKVFNLADLIEKLHELEEPAVMEHNLLLEIEMDSNVPERFLGDKLKLQRVLLNLVSNAVKFTNEGKITVGIRLVSRERGTAYIEFSVKDTGVGIAEEKQEKVFNRFFKMNATRKANYVGNGLGLDIVQRYVRLLGGEISLQSKAGEGSSFFFVLPMKVFPGAGRKKSLSGAHKKSFIASVNGHTRTKTPRLLLVEDNRMALMHMQLMIKDLGIEPQTAVNSEAALEAIRQSTFDLVITDIELPDGSGYGLSEQIRALEKEAGQKPIQIIGLTGHSAKKLAEVCKSAGMDDVYEKPMTIALLKKLVTRVFQGEIESNNSVQENRTQP
jgi:two-component system, OmpR family, aerobic respiration control sensor histidine kinase ArcB